VDWQRAWFKGCMTKKHKEQ